ncbi:MAG: glutaredoxin family protein [Glaciecola sp.]|jgi:hypothetical protein|nr:glutaredoxin family protein [Glaciecola sp.]MDG1814775.1 glutaredoxin family protein [Glaciecola sp.]MDG2098920.1 glutaredoxin family protein [Glaciecola sp.]
MTQTTKQIWLIGGEDCALCDDADKLLTLALAANPNIPIEVSYVNVKSTTTLFHHYGARIPVLLDLDSNVALYWPFELPQVQEFIRT